MPLWRRAGCVLISGLLAAMSFAPLATAGEKRLDRSKVDSYVSSYLHRNGLPGASIAVVKDAQVIHVAGFGRDAGGARVTAHTPMALGSVSKSFTAFAVLQLVAAGDVELDEPVVSYLPEFDVDDPRGSKITVRQLLSHTSGLPNPTIVPPARTLEQAVTRTADWRLASGPGSRYAYANANYWVAARLVEVVGGEPFARYLDAHVFTPLGMSETRAVNTTRADVPGARAGYVTAYGGALPMREMDDFVGGAGGVVSTAHDMARWLAMQANGGRTADGKSLLPPALLEQSHTVQPNAGSYGLGWSRSSPGIDPKRISHSGANTRISAQQDLVPSSGYGVAVMLDSFTPTLEHPYEISSGVIDITEGGAPAPGAPVPTLVDLALGAVTLATLGLAVRGLVRSRVWARRRAAWPAWRYGLRLLPQLVVPCVAAWLFLVLPTLQDNTATPLDVFGLWPAAVTLVLALAAAGVALTAVRVARRAGESGRR